MTGSLSGLLGKKRPTAEGLPESRADEPGLMKSQPGDRLSALPPQTRRRLEIAHECSTEMLNMLSLK